MKKLFLIKAATLLSSILDFVTIIIKNYLMDKMYFEKPGLKILDYSQSYIEMNIVITSTFRKQKKILKNMTFKKPIVYGQN